ncbi:MAG: DUF1571 domain-containing protein [Pirellulaceae bacterium]
MTESNDHQENTTTDSVTMQGNTHSRTSLGFTRILLIGLGLGAFGLCLFVAGAFAWQTFVGSATEEVVPGLVIETAEDPETDHASDSEFTGILAELNDDHIAEDAHPLDPFLKVAELGRKKLLEEVRDYTALMQATVRLENGKLRDQQVMRIKIRHPNTDPEDVVPFSIYSRFISPASLAGQEAIWVDGWHEGNLVGHPPGILNLRSFYLDPDGKIAMNGNRHPIYEMGMAKLLDQMIDKGTRDRDAGDDVSVAVERGVKLNDRECLRITIIHPEERAPYDFHRAVIYVDVENEWPIGYEAYAWPKSGDDEPPLIESYYYQEIEPNVGLTDFDFDTKNEAYKFPG